MKAVVKNSAERGVEYVTDHPDPKPADGQVVIEVAAASLCGTDREVYEWTPSAQAFNLNLPVRHRARGRRHRRGGRTRRDRAPGRRPRRAGEPPGLRTVQVTLEPAA
jgi:threonine dehydrogenase-like Zn-dependent dehydrogenase